MKKWLLLAAVATTAVLMVKKAMSTQKNNSIDIVSDDIYDEAVKAQPPADEQPAAEPVQPPEPTDTVLEEAAEKIPEETPEQP